jgi:tellurite resistance protein
MRSRDVLDAAEALVLTMVLVSAADGGITDREIGIMSGLVQTLPAFHTFNADQFRQVTDAAVALLREDDGLKHAGRLLRSALSARLHETAYALACEVVAGDCRVRSASLDMLEFVRQELHLDPLIAAAIERGIRARYVPVE